MDIRIVFSRLAIFTIVYTLVLGVPFYIYFALKQSFLSLVIMGLLATVGPFIYLYLQRAAEKRILKEENRIKDLLMNASNGMTQVRELDSLLEAIGNLLKSSLRLENVAVYLINRESFSMPRMHEAEEGNNRYILKFSKPDNSHHPGVFAQNDPLIRQLLRRKASIIYEDVKVSSWGGSRSNDDGLHEVVSQMKELSAQVVVPAMANDVLLGFIALGERHAGDVYSQDLKNVLAVMGNHAALAIENVMFVEEAEKNLAKKAHDMRLKSLGAMGSGVAHQIRNRFNIMSGHVSFFLAVLEKLDLCAITRERSVELIERAKYIMEIIFDNTMRGEKICVAINSYSKLTDEKEAASLGVVFDMAVDLLRGRVDFDNLDVDKDIPGDLRFYGVVPMIQDVFVNLIINADDATQAKKERIKIGDWDIPDYRPTITVKACETDAKVVVYFSDNGTGFKPEHEQNAFVPFYTTKGTRDKEKSGGTGLGLNLIWDFLIKNGGDIELRNTYQEGAVFRITLPLPPKEGEADGR